MRYTNRRILYFTLRLCVCLSVSVRLCTCMCVCLSVREDISRTIRAIVTNFVHVAYGRGSVLLRHRCDMLCTSSFVDDIMFFFYNEPYSGRSFATKDRFRLNLVIYHKVGENSMIILLKRTILTNYFKITCKLK